jgi:hypothetical protein
MRTVEVRFAGASALRGSLSMKAVEICFAVPQPFEARFAGASG